MRTALDKILDAIRLEDDAFSPQWMDSFVFKYNGCHVELLGHYYAAVVLNDDFDEMQDYCWKDFDDMLDCTIEETGKTIRRMLSELKESDLEIQY